MKIHKPNRILFILPIILVVIIIVLICVNKTKTESFSGGGFGFDSPTNNFPIFSNLYPPIYTQSMGSLEKLLNLSFKTAQHGVTKSPLIICPDLGESKIWATWDLNQTPNVRELDREQNFDQSTKWNCRKVQDKMSPLWYPPVETDDPTQFCWSNTSSVLYDSNNNLIHNQKGVNTLVTEFGNIDFVSPEYMITLMEVLGSIGYSKGNNLFCAPYDFRKILSRNVWQEYELRLTQMIENSFITSGKKVTLFGHGLGSVILNLFLNKKNKKWKDTYCKCLISFAGSFGGCPKALRTILSGSDYGNIKKNIFQSTISNYSGLQLLLPNPIVYGNFEIATYNNIKYTTNDIERLLHENGHDSASIYHNITLPMAKQSIEAPGVLVYAFAGTGVQTESSYKYNMSLNTDPNKSYPTYSSDLAAGPSQYEKFQYPSEFNGDGTIPNFCSEIPLYWTSKQSEEIRYKFYNLAEHRDILDNSEAIDDLVSILN